MTYWMADRLTETLCQQNSPRSHLPGFLGKPSMWRICAAELAEPTTQCPGSHMGCQRTSLKSYCPLTLAGQYVPLGSHTLACWEKLPTAGVHVLLAMMCMAGYHTVASHHGLLLFCRKSRPRGAHWNQEKKALLFPVSLQRPLLTKLNIVPVAKRETFAESRYITTGQAIKDHIWSREAIS